MPDEFLTPGRVKPLGRLLAITVAFGVVLVLMSLPQLFGDFERYGAIVLGIGVVFAALGGLALRAVRAHDDRARLLAIVTGVLLVVCSVPLVVIWVGLLTAITGVGLLVIAFAPERVS